MLSTSVFMTIAYERLGRLVERDHLTCRAYSAACYSVLDAVVDALITFLNMSADCN